MKVGSWLANATCFVWVSVRLNSIHSFYGPVAQALIWGASFVSHNEMIGLWCILRRSGYMMEHTSCRLRFSCKDHNVFRAWCIWSRSVCVDVWHSLMRWLLKCQRIMWCSQSTLSCLHILIIFSLIKSSDNVIFWLEIIFLIFSEGFLMQSITEWWRTL